MKKTISAIMLIAALASISFAREGAHLVLMNKTGQIIEGELLAVKHGVLLLRESYSQTGVSADINDLESIRVKRTSHTLLGIGIGVALGTGVGVIAGSSAAHTANKQYNDNPNVVSGIFAASSNLYPVVLGIAGCLVGGVVGGLLGSASSRDMTIMLGGRPDAEIQKALGWLRSNSRYTEESN